MSGDLDRLQGTWHVRSIEADGQQMSAVDGARIVIKGKAFTSLGMGAAYEGTVEVDETSKPKRFELLFTGGHAAGTRNRGIYTLDGGLWTICLATRGGRRPTGFGTRADTGLVLQTLARRKPPANVRRAAITNVSTRPRSTVSSAELAGPRSGDTTIWEGEWSMVAAVFSGAPMAGDMVKWCKRITRGDVTSVVAGPQTMLKARFSLDTSTTPAAVDYVNLTGAQKGKAQQGIFELTMQTLRVCMAAPGTPRPAEFSSKKGDGRSYTTWRILKEN